MTQLTRPTCAWRVVLALGALTYAAGCMSPAVFNYRGDLPVPQAERRIPAMLVLNDLAIPNTRTTVSAARSVVATERVGAVRFHGLERHLGELWSESGSADGVRFARDLSSDGAPASAFVVQYRVLSYATSSSVDAGGVFAGIVGTVLTGGLTGGGLVFMATTRVEHDFEVEVRLYRVADSSLTSMAASQTGERVSQYDVSGAELIHRASYPLQIRSGYCQACVPSGAEGERFHREEGNEMAQAVFRASAEGIQRAAFEAMDSVSEPTAETPRTTPAAPQPAASASGPEEGIRSALDAHSAAILLCTASEQALVTVEWSEDAAVVGLRGVDDDGVLGCVRAAVGSLPLPSGASPGSLIHAITSGEQPSD